MNSSMFQLLFYLSIKEESLLHANYFYCEKVATQVFLNGSTDRKNRLSSHLNAWTESLSPKVKFFEITILFQR